MTQRAANGPNESSLFVCRIIRRSIAEASNQNSTRLQKVHFRRLSRSNMTHGRGEASVYEEVI